MLAVRQFSAVVTKHIIDNSRLLFGRGLAWICRAEYIYYSRSVSSSTIESRKKTLVESGIDYVVSRVKCIAKR